jgi:hypothetical protein
MIHMYSTIPYALYPYQPGVITQPESEIGSSYFTLHVTLGHETLDYLCANYRVCVTTCTIVVCRMKYKIMI